MLNLKIRVNTNDIKTAIDVTNMPLKNAVLLLIAGFAVFNFIGFFYALILLSVF